MANPMKIEERLFDPRVALALTKEGLNPVLAKIYAARGISTKAEAEPSASVMPHFTKMKNCVKMAEALADAMHKGQKILVVADYDADGATGCTVAVRALQAFGANVDYLIPHRLEHGYGLTPEVASLALERNPDIILTVDNGISSFEGIDLANTFDVRVFVTDHHLPGPDLPPAEIIVNPNQPGETFPTTELAGVGVVFYVMWALRETLIARGKAEDSLPRVSDLLPILAVGTIADVVPLRTLNRTLVREGLARIRSGRGFPGIDAIAKVAKCTVGRLTSQDVAFMVAPRINAAGRLNSMTVGVEALLTNNVAKAEDLAKQLQDLNDLRKTTEAKALEAASEQIAQTISVDDSKNTVVAGSPEWHPGVIGIVAGRLKEKYYKPAFIFALDDSGKAKGSGRSIPGFHLRDALAELHAKHPAILEKFGGHAMAAGVTVAKGQLPAFEKAFEEIAQLRIPPEALLRTILTDGELSSEFLSEDFADMLDSKVWGQEFPPPLFQGAFTVRKQDLLKDKLTGEEKHSRFWLEKDGRVYTAIKFGFIAPVGNSLVCTYSPSLNIWNDKREVQLRIDHIVGFDQ